MKKIVFTIFVILIAAILSAVPSDEVIQNAANELGIPFANLKAYVNTFYPESPSSEVLEVTVQQYLKDFDDNAYSAYNKYRGRLLRFTITIKEIDISSGFRIRSEESYDYQRLSFEIEDSYENILGTLKKGDRIIVEGYLWSDSTIQRTKIIQIL